jgi:hypothetical protein
MAPRWLDTMYVPEDPGSNPVPFLDAGEYQFYRRHDDRGDTQSTAGLPADPDEGD